MKGRSETTMQRRKVDGATTTNTGITAPTSRGVKSPTSSNRNKASSSRARSSSSSTPSSLWMLMASMILIALLSIMSPSTMKNVEQEIVKDATLVEKEVENWLNHVPESSATTTTKTTSSDSKTAAMELQPSSWVDGEKKLKQKLKILEERQRQGKDVGAPILTRWLGDDMPVWAGEGVDKKEWEKKRDAMYKEMRVEEEEWKKKARNFLEAEKRLKEARHAMDAQTTTQ